MGMPLDLYVIRHGESEANVIISAGEQGDNSLYTQDNVTVPDRSWRLTATGRTHKRFRWEQTARPVLDETDGRWVVKVDDWREFKRPVLSNGDLVDVVHAVDRHL